MSGPELTPGTLQFAVFETVRKLGGRAADRQTITHDGQRYGLTVDLVCDLKAHLVTIQHLDSPGKLHHTAMAIADLLTNDVADVRGLGLAFETLVMGETVSPAHLPSLPIGVTYHVIPFTAVPLCYASLDGGVGNQGAD